jgi:type II secretory pathway component GspD/PulD (secretin)
LLNQLFKDLKTARRGTGGTPTVITSDERLNVIIVHGSRADREVVASLLKTLDSPDIADAKSINQPVIVTVRNTDAGRVLTILNSIYRAQLSSGGGRKQVSIPEGIAPELATMLQQVNAATSGPLLTLGVDTITNSIIVMAPPQLRDQVRSVIEQLDNAVETEPGEQVEIIQFRNASPARIQKALDMLLKDGKK